MNTISQYAKGIAALVFAVATAVSVQMTTIPNWVTYVIAAASVIAVYGIPNGPDVKAAQAQALAVDNVQTNVAVIPTPVDQPTFVGDNPGA